MACIKVGLLLLSYNHAELKTLCLGMTLLEEHFV